MRRMLQKSLAMLLAAVIVLPIVLVKDVSAASTDIQKANAQYLSRYLYENGDAEYEGYKGVTVCSELESGDVKNTYLMGSADGSKIFFYLNHSFSYIMESQGVTHRRAQKDDYFATFNCSTLSFSGNAKYHYLISEYANNIGYGEGDHYAPITTAYDPDVALDWDDTFGGEDSYFAMMFNNIEAYLREHQFSLGMIGFTADDYSAAFVNTGEWNNIGYRFGIGTYGTTKTFSFTLFLNQNTSVSTLNYALVFCDRTIKTGSTDVVAYGVDETTGLSTYKADFEITKRDDFYEDGFYKLIITDAYGREVYRTSTTVHQGFAPGPGLDDLPEFDAASGGSGVEGFVSRLYSVVLNREGDTEGQAYWIEKLNSKEITGGDAARFFLTSSEFTNVHYDDEAFVEILYRVFFNRTNADDRDGYGYWLNALFFGATEYDVINGFINSSEWATLCASYLIQSGGTGTPAISLEIYEFASGLYSSCLGRTGDREGIDYWANELKSGNATGTEAARAFFYSEEYTSLRLSRYEYVARLYRTFMGRAGSRSELSYWSNSTLSKDELFATFAGSEEFAQRCANAGINP